jgi:ribonuclease HII
LLKRYSNQIVAGCDEAGRGCLAGPVFAAAVILPQDYKNNILNDSKVLNLTKRNLLRTEIERIALAWAVAKISPLQIDKINILNASILAMQKAVGKLSIVPEILIIDGNRFKPYRDIPHECIIKGDGKYLSIAAASILAKTHRDEYMEGLAIRHPQYKWENNKGYPTKAHRRAISSNGPTKYHRMSFQLLPLPEQQKLF